MGGRTSGEVQKVATREQVQANRRNAKKSTGPRTQAGKDASKMNAIRHGILARSVVVPNLEAEEEWTEHRRGVIESLAPVGGLEEALAARIAEILWRIRRVGWHERNEVLKNYAESAPVYWFELQDRGEAGGRELPGLPQLAAIARYEAHLQRSLMQTTRELDRLQSKRREGMAGRSDSAATAWAAQDGQKGASDDTALRTASHTDGREESTRGKASDLQRVGSENDETKPISPYDAEVNALLAGWHAELEANQTKQS
jgi:hypothetical protein